MRLARRSYVRARQHAGKPGVRVDVVELSGGDEAQIAAVRRPPSSAPAKIQFSHPTGTARSSRSAAFSDLQSRPSSGKRPNASQRLRQQFIALVMSLFQERLARCSYNYSSSSTIGERLHFWRARKCSYAVKPLISSSVANSTSMRLTASAAIGALLSRARSITRACPALSAASMIGDRCG